MKSKEELVAQVQGDEVRLSVKVDGVECSTALPVDDVVDFIAHLESLVDDIEEQGQEENNGLFNTLNLQPITLKLPPIPLTPIKFDPKMSLPNYGTNFKYLLQKPPWRVI